MSFNIPFSDFLNGGLNPNSLTARGSTAQNVNVTDLVCEGPVRGLVGGEAGLHLDDVPVQDANFKSFTSYQPSGDNQQTFSGNITFSGSSTGTLSDELDISELELDENSPRSLTLQNYKLTSVTVTNTVENAGLTTLTLSAASGTPFTTEWNSGQQLSDKAFAVVSLVQDDFSLSGFFFISNSSTAAIMVYGVVPPTTGTFTLVVDYTIPITALNSANNQLTLAATPTSGSYKFVIGAQVTASDNGEVTAGTSSVVSKIDKLNIDFRKGDLYQPVTTSTGGVGGAVAVTGNTSLISGPAELKIISQTLADSLGVTIFDKNGLPNINGNKDYPGSPDFSVMATSVTTLPSSAFGLDTAVKIKEADEIGFSIKYPALQVINLEKGDKETAYAFYVMQIRFEQNNSYGSWKTLFPGQEYVRHVGNTNAPVSFDHDINLEGYRKIVGPFEDFQVRLFRVTRHIGLPVRISGTNEDDTNKKKWQLSASSSIENLRAVIKDHFTYPYSAVASVSFSSRQFDGVPKRSYLLEGKLVKVPSTYTPREYSDTGIADYEGFWDGQFRDTLFYTDNPAWVFYDIVTNNRYGAGKWIQETDIDKYALYRVARYCDELVDDGSVYTANSSFVVGELYKIKSVGDTSWSSIGSSSSTVNTIFRATDTSITGTGTACRVEPRFRANVFLTKATDVYKVLKDFATIFLGILYWQDSKVVAVQDAPQDPVYNFTKGNVIDGAFSYESSGARTRSNQAVVTWNDPTINYQPVPIVVEDRESIVRSGRIITENVVAFGATSESQAIRYGKWKLWTAQNQTEIVSFKTSLAAHYIKPGDVINVQDADRFGISYSGRTSSATSTTLTFDRNVSFNSGSTYELSTLVTEPAALNASESSITINSVIYERGEKIDQAYVYDGSSYELVDLNTEKRASNAFSDSSGNNLIPTIWKPYTYVETHEITNPGNTANTVTLANSVTFDSTPSKHNIWALKETSGNLNVAGSQKMYKVLSITEESPNTFTVSAVEYFDEKFIAVEEDYALGTIPQTIYVENEPVTIPRPTNPRVILATDAKKPGEELVLEWDQDESDSIVQYEVLHSIEGIDNPIKTKSRQVSFNNVPNGSVTFKVRAISRKGNISSYTAIDYGVYDPFGENVPRMAGGIPKGVISTAQGVIDSNNHFKFQATNASVASVTNPFVTYTISGTKNVSAISVDEPYYLYLDVATPSLKLLEYDSTALSNLQFYRDVGTGNAALSTAWTSIGTVSVAANSNEVTGSGFNNNVKLRDVLNLQNSTSPSGGDGAVVIGIISNTKLLIDRTFGTAKTNITGYRSAFRPDYANDSIFAEITKSGSTISTNNFITLRSQADEIEGTTETLDDGTIAVKDGGISVDKIQANSINADKIQANSITTNELIANSVTTNTLAANVITSKHIEASSVVASLLTAATIQSNHIKANSIVSTIIDATTINASDITTTTLSALTANMGDITAGTMKGGTMPDTIFTRTSNQNTPTGSESGAFMDLTDGKMVFGNTNKNIVFDGSDLILSGVTIDANSIVNATAAADIEVKEDGTSEGTGIASFNFTTGLNLSVNGTEATLSANDQTPSWVPSTNPNYLTGITTAQVRTAGALMDDELTDLVGVKGVTISTLQPKPSEGAFVDGDKNKLDGIASGATNTAAPFYTSAIAVGDGGLTQKNFTTTLKNKLDGIAAGATNTAVPFYTSAIPTATTTTDGLMDNTDKSKLDGIAAGATNTAAPFYTSAIAVGDGGLTQKNFTTTLKNKLDGIAAGATNTAVPFYTSAIPTATTTTDGLMDNTDKSKLDGIAAGATNTAAPFYTSAIAVGDGGLTQKNFTTTLKNKLDGIASGATNTAAPFYTSAIAVGDGGLTQKNFTTTLKGKLDGIAAGATNTAVPFYTSAIPTATTTTDGLMDNTDKNKLDGIASGATNTAAPFYTSAIAVGDGGLTQKNFTTTLKDKLDGIASGATNTAAPFYTSAIAVGDGGLTQKNFTTTLKGKLDGIAAGATNTAAPFYTSAISNATTSAAGLMSSTDKSKLNNIEASADVTDTANVVASLTAGTNVSIAANGTISSTNTTYSAGTGLSLSAQNEFSVNNTVVTTNSGAQTIAGTKTFSDNVIVTGNFTVNGTTTTINTATLTVEDNIIVVNSAQAGTPGASVTAGLEVERGDSANVRLVYAETGLGPSNNLAGWNFGNTNVTADTFYGDFIGDIVGSPSSFGTLTTDDLTEGDDNLYYLDSRVIAALSGGSGIDKSATGEFTVDSTVVRTSGNQTVGGIKTFTSNVLIHNATPVLELKDTSDDDDHHIYFKTSTGAVKYSIDTQNDTSGDALTLYSSAQEIVHRIGNANIFESHGTIVKSLKNFDVTGNITLSGTVDGRDLVTDGSKLDGIAAGATNTAAPFYTSAIAVGDGGLTQKNFTTTLKGKLDGIAAGATNTAAPFYTSAIAVGDGGLTQKNFTTTLKGKLDGIAAGATNTAAPFYTSAIPTATTTTDGLMDNTDKSKLDGIAAGATNTAAPFYTSAIAVGDGGLTQKNFTTTLKDKLDGIASGATNTAAPFYTSAIAVGDGGLTQKNFTTTLKGKLDGIAAGATNTAVPFYTSAIPTATTTTDGLMDNTDKNKLDGIASGATNTAAPFYTSAIAVGDGGLTQKNFTTTLKDKLDGIASGATNTAVPFYTSAIPTATTTTDGLMDNTDKSKLDGIAAGATNTAAPFYTSAIAVGDGGLTQKNFTTTLKGKLDGIAAGATNTAAPFYTSAIAVGDGGLTQKNFTTTLKGKLDGIAAGATNTAVPFYTSAISSSDVTGALGFTPYNSTNPSGFITNSTASLSGAKITSGTIAEARLPTQSKYLRSDTADTATGKLTLNGGLEVLSGSGGGALRIKRNSGAATGDDVTDIHMDDNALMFDIDNDNDGDGGVFYFRKKSGGNFAAPTAYLGTNQRIFADNYHPNADKWTTSRTLSLTGDVTGSVSWDGSANASITAAVVNNSHQHSSLFENATITFGASSLQWMDQNGAGGNGLNGNAPRNPTNGWYHNLIMNHGNSSGYYSQISTGLNTSDIYFSRVQQGVAKDWQRIFADDYHPNADTLTTARNIGVTLSGDVTGTGSASFNGSAAIDIAITTTGGGGVTGVTAGNGLSGGGSGAVSLAVDLNELNTATTALTTDFIPIVKASTNVSKKILLSEVIDDLDLVTGNVTGSLFADVIVANSIETDMLKANTITADKIAANLITASKIAADSITAQQLQVATESGSGIYMELVSGKGVISIKEGSTTRVKIGYLGT